MIRRTEGLYVFLHITNMPPSPPTRKRTAVGGAFVLENSIDSGAFRPSDNRVQNPWNVVRVAGSLITHSGERHFDNPVFLHADGRRMLLFSNLKEVKKHGMREKLSNTVLLL